MKNIKLIGILFISLLILGGCTKGWEEMNIDPNGASDVPAENILINLERSMSDRLGDVWWTGNNSSSYAGHIAKIQYIDENRYIERETTIDDWGDLIGYQVDLDKIILKSQAAENPAMEGVALTLKAMLWQIMTDTWGAVPFTEGAKGEEGILQPAYDDQETVYTGILAMLETANTKLAEGGTIKNDIINANNVAIWQKFANSLHLRVAIRMSNVNPAGAKTELQKILGNPATYPILASNSDQVSLEWVGTSPYYEPYYDDQRTRDDHGMCKTFIDALNATSDPRIGEFAYPAASDGLYRGVPAGMSLTQESATALNSVSRIGYRYRKNLQAQHTGCVMQRLSLSRLKLIFVLTCLMMQQKPKRLMSLALRLHVKNTVSSSGAITTYLANTNVGWGLTGSWGYTNLQKIYYQKWVSLFKQGPEAWAETRRTDIPLMGIAPGATPATLLTAHNRPPFRWPYPQSEYSLNETVVSAADDGIVDRFWGDQLWWDTRTGVN